MSTWLIVPCTTTLCYVNMALELELGTMAVSENDEVNYNNAPTDAAEQQNSAQKSNSHMSHSTNIHQDDL